MSTLKPFCILHFLFIGLLFSSSAQSSIEDVEDMDGRLTPNLAENTAAYMLLPMQEKLDDKGFPPGQDQNEESSDLPQLPKDVCTLFSMHPARKETLSAMIFGTMVSGNVHHIDLSRYLSTLKPEHALRRVQRFFQHQDLELSDSARSMIAFLKFEGKFDLCLDRTNWKFGEKDINYLVLSWWVNRFVTIPLLAIELDKAGNSNAQERIDLLKRFGQLFGFDRIKALIADREFIGDAWFRELLKWEFPFFVRVKENGLVPYGDNPIHVKVLFDHLKNGEYRKVEKDMYGSIVYFSGTRAETGDLVIVISNQSYSPRTILNTYRKRWSIEEMFRKLKTSGFHWENTHIKNHPDCSSF